MHHRSHASVLLLASVVALAACTPGPSLVSTRFQLATAGGEGSPMAGGPESVGTVPPAPGGVTAVGQGAGRLTIGIEGLLPAQRRLMATIADVERVEIEVWSGTLARATATVERAALQAGVRTHTFTGLPYARYTVSVTAFDVAGTKIGESMGGAVIDGPIPALVQIAMRLTPTVRTPAPQATGTGGGSGGGAATPTPTPLGGIEAQITLQDGLDLVQLVERATFDLPASAMSMCALPGGGVAVHGEGFLTAFDADAGLTRTTTVTTDGIEMPRADAQGTTYLADRPNQQIWRIGPTGAHLPELALPQAVLQWAPAPDGDLWFVRSGSLERLAPDGSTRFQVPISGQPYHLVVGSRDTIYLVFADRVEERNAQGSVLTSRAFGTTGSFPLRAGIDRAVDDVAVLRDDGLVINFTAAGQATSRAGADPDGDPLGFATTANGDLWVARGHGRTLYFARYEKGSSTHVKFHAAPSLSLGGIDMDSFGFERYFCIDEDGVFWLLDPFAGKLRAFNLPS